jgi:chromosome segregation ATPase
MDSQQKQSILVEWKEDQYKELATRAEEIQKALGDLVDEQDEVEVKMDALKDEIEELKKS